MLIPNQCPPASALRGLRFAFYGRVSTEDNQDPEASRNWQRARATALIEPAGGRIVAEFFDIGLSRSLPWKRREQAALLLAALADPGRGFDAVVIGEPQRAFYGNQYGLTMPVFSHYAVGLWVPEVGGAIDPESEAHDLIMSVFGGMSKGERSRVKIRVRSAMASQAKIEGRFLGGQPPYGYQIADAGPHPNPAKAAGGKRLHRLEPDPVAAPVVRRIFREYMDGHGLHAIAEGLSREGIPCPSAHDPARNSHRMGIGWPKSAITVILTNPRYTGRQVWNRQRKQEILLDIDDVAAGYETKFKWNEPGSWIWSDGIAHEPLVSVEDFETVQGIRVQRRKNNPAEPHQRKQRSSKRHYVLSGLLHCAICGRKMESTFNHDRPHYRCRYAGAYAAANKIVHPPAVYVREDMIVPHLDKWLCKIFAPHRIDQTVQVLADASAHDDHVQAAEAARRGLAVADRKLGQYRALLEAGTDPMLVAGWIREVETEKNAMNARLRELGGRAIMTTEEITAMVHGLGDLVKLLGQAEPADKMKIYDRLRLRLEYDPGARLVTVNVKTAGLGLEPDPDGRVRKVRVRGGT